jgi:hypothetical protein
MKKFTKNTTLGKILEKPGAEQILLKYRVPCLSCPMSKFEIEDLEIGKVAELYGLDLDSLLKELNEKI